MKLWESRWPLMFSPAAVSAYTYGKNKNLDVRNGVVMMASVLVFTLLGSYLSSLVPNTAMGSFSTFMTLLLGLKFIIRPVMTTKESMAAVSLQKRFLQSVICGALVGFICGFIGAGGGMMMLLILTAVLGYELKTRRGNQRLHYDLHRADRFCIPFCHRRRTGYPCAAFLCFVHLAVGAYCGQVCQ